MTIPNNSDTAQGQDVPTGDPSGLAAEPTDTGAQPEVQDNNPVYWNELQSLPESVRPLVEPIFKEWDSNVGKKLQSVHSEYEPYKPLFDEWEPDALSQAISVMQALQENPESVIKALIEAYDIDLGQGAADQLQQGLPEDVEDDDLDPRYQALTQQQEEQAKLLEVLANTLLSEREQKAQQEAVHHLDSTLNDLRGQYGEFDEDYVLSLIAQNVEPEQAVAQFFSSIERFAPKGGNTNPAPVVLGRGGGIPSNGVDPASLNDKDTKDLVIQMLQAAKQQA